MYQWQIQSVELPLRFKWTISRGSSVAKTLFFVTVYDDQFKGIGEVAGITADPKKSEAILRAFDEFRNQSVSELEEIIELSLPTHLKFGITSALTHLLAQKQNKTLLDFLNVPNVTPIKTSFSLPILKGQQLKEFFDEYQLGRFPFLKVKISKEHPLDSCLALSEVYFGPIRVDANEAFENHQEVLEFIEQIKHLNIEFVEQPLPRDLWTEHKKLKAQSPLPILADESLQDQLLTEEIRDSFHGINVKLMKAGSYQRALEQLRQARAWGMKTMLGCMVESSLGIAGAMAVADQVDYCDLDGFLYFQNEPHQLVTENKGQLTYRQTPSPFVD